MGFFFVLKIPVLPSFRVEHLLENLGEFETLGYINVYNEVW